MPNFVIIMTDTQNTEMVGAYGFPQVDTPNLDRLAESDELYDLRSDPRELHNRIDDPALAPVLAKLKDRMLAFFLETGDAVPFDADRR